MPAAAAKPRSRKFSGNSRQPPDLPLRDRVAAQLQSLAAEAQCAELADGAADPEIAGDTVYRLMAHQLAAGHALTMSLGAHAGRLVREAKAGATGDDDGGRRSQEMLRFVAGTARLMERCRSAALALDRIGFPEVPEEVPDGPGEGEPMQPGTVKGFPRQVIASRDRERRRLLHWLAEGKKLRDLPEVEDWPEYHNPDLPDLERLDERLSPSAQSSANDAAGPYAEPGMKRGRLKNGNPVGDYLAAPRCGAGTRAGPSCRQPAMPNGRCRFHGGKSTGPRTAEGLRRSRSARLTHGFRTAEIIDLRSAAARIGRDLRSLTRAHATQERLTAKAPRRKDSEAPVPLALRTTPIVNSAQPMAAPINRNQTRSRRTPPPHAIFAPLRLCGEPCTGRPAGHGVHRPELPRPPSTAGHRQRQRRRRRA